MAEGDNKLPIDEPREWPDDIVMRERKLRFAVMVLAVLVAFAAIVNVVAYRQTRIAREELIELSRNNQAVLAEVQECTNPGGECFEAGVRTRLLLEKEALEVAEHRDRNEELHEAICKREDEIAKALNIEVETECPPRLSPGADGHEH